MYIHDFYFLLRSILKFNHSFDENKNFKIEFIHFEKLFLVLPVDDHHIGKENFQHHANVKYYYYLKYYEQLMNKELNEIRIQFQVI